MIILFLIASNLAKRLTEFGQIPLVTDAEKTLGKFEIIAKGLIATIHAVQAPSTGKIIQLERYDGGQGGTSHNAEFDYYTGYSRSLSTLTDIFCSSGFVSTSPDGKIFSVGGWNGPSVEAVRYFTPCGKPGGFGTCNWYEDKQTASLKLPRWYPSALPLPSGRVAVIGGTTSPTGLQPPAINQPSVEFLPAVKNENPITIKLLVETDTYNLYPIVHVLSTGEVFMMSGTRSQILNAATFDMIKELPEIGEGKRTYPFTGGSVLLPLSSANNWVSEVFVCGGTSGPTKQSIALETCGRIAPSIPNAEWQMEAMPMRRLMPDMVNLIDGTVLIINGAGFGWAGFDSSTEPVFKPVIYNPALPVGKRFTSLAASTIARMYHSEALLVEDGTVLVMGSTPNANANQQNTEFPNEQRIEVFYPPYLLTGLKRPTLLPLQNKNILNMKPFEVFVEISGPDLDVKLLLFTNGFVTHSNHQGQRMVYLDFTLHGLKNNWYRLEATVPNENIVPPGHYMLFCTNKNMPAIAQWVIVGNDQNNFQNWPPVAPKA